MESRLNLKLKFLGENPLATDPILMNPEAGDRVSDALSSGFEIDVIGTAVGPRFSGDDADPPAVIVESVDLLVEGEAAGNGERRRQGTELVGVDGLGQRLGLVVLEKGGVANDVEADVEGGHHRGFVVGSGEAVALDGDFHALASAELHCCPLQRSTHG